MFDFKKSELSAGFTEIVSIIENANSVVLFPHVSADGDALGASIALGLVLAGQDKKVEILVEEQIPDIYTFLPGIYMIKEYSSYSNNCDAFDLGIVLDSSDMLRLGSRADFFKSCPKTINIDHHATNLKFADYNYVDTFASATGEIIYQLIDYMNIKLTIDVATCLYVSILTDTGGFKHSNTTSFTHKVAAQLIDVGIDAFNISNRIFSSFSMQKLKLLCMVIETIQLFFDNRVAIAYVTKEMLHNSGTLDEDADGIIEFIERINGIEVFALLRERDNNSIKVSLRSKGDVDVSKIAMNHSGGGHKRAAGATIIGSIEYVINTISSDILGKMSV